MKIILPLILCLAAPAELAQTDSLSIEAVETIEDLMTENEEESDIAAEYEFIEEKLENPVDLNNAGIPELLSIPYMDLHTANRIMEHRNKFGPFFSTAELYSVKEIQSEVISKILPFLMVNKVETEIINEEIKSGSSFTNFRLKVRSRAGKDLQIREAYKDNKYRGSGIKYYNRFHAEYMEKFQAGMLTEKDAGENKLNEFTSFYLSAEDLGIIKNFTAGDYSVEFGQGITLWSPYAFSKGSDAVFTVKKQKRNLRAYKSSDENRFFRGAAGEILLGTFTLTAFFSLKKFDALVDSASNLILSLPSTGLHRTESELKKKKTAGETLIGTIIGYSVKNNLHGFNINIGAAYYHSKFTHPFHPPGPNEIKGNKFNNSAVCYDFLWKSLNLFGEFSYNGISAASVNGFIISVTENFSFISFIRSYPRNFFSLHGAPTAEGTAKNEVGFYSGIRWRTKMGIINFYYDQFKFPYAGYSIPLPSGGNEMLLYLSSKPLPKLETRLRLKYEEKETVGYNDLSRIIANRIRRSCRLDMIYIASKSIRLKGRFEINDFEIKELNERETGILFYQDFRIGILRRVTLSGRVIFFRTHSFSSAVYGYENDLPGVYANQAMYGEGVKWYLLMRYELLENIIISFRYSELFKPDQKFLYSGNDKISGNLDNKLGIQLDINF